MYIALLLVVVACAHAYKSELVLQDPKEIGEVILTRRPHEYLTLKDIPASVDYRPAGKLNSLAMLPTLS